MDARRHIQIQHLARPYHLPVDTELGFRLECGELDPTIGTLACPVVEGKVQQDEGLC